jgi:hypothetical protein
MHSASTLGSFTASSAVWRKGLLVIGSWPSDFSKPIVRMLFGSSSTSGERKVPVTPCAGTRPLGPTVTNGSNYPVLSCRMRRIYESGRRRLEVTAKAAVQLARTNDHVNLPSLCDLAKLVLHHHHPLLRPFNWPSVISVEDSTTQSSLSSHRVLNQQPYFPPSSESSRFIV